MPYRPHCVAYFWGIFNCKYGGGVVVVRIILGVVDVGTGNFQFCTADFGKVCESSAGLPQLISAVLQEFDRFNKAADQVDGQDTEKDCL